MWFSRLLARYRNEKRLSESEERYRKLLEGSHDLIWAVDATGVITYINHASRRMYGREPEEMIGQPYARFMPADQLEIVEALLEAIQAGRAVTDFRSTMLHSDGSVVVVRSHVMNLLDDAGRVIGTTGTSRDVTETERAEELLRQTIERLELVARATNDVVWDWDLGSSSLWWNENYAKLFGYSETERAPGIESWTKHIHPDDLHRVKAGITSVIESGSTYWEDEYRFRRRDGTDANIFDRGYVIRNAAGVPTRMIGAMMDVTERKQSEERARQSDQQLRQAQKMEAVGQLSGGIAHDFNNLLTIIQGNASLLALETNSVERADCTDEILRAVQRGVSLTRQLLTFSRKQIMQRGDINLGDIASHMVKMLERTLPESILISSEGDADLPLIDGDAAMIEQVILNLAVNSRDSMPDGGRLSFSTRATVIDAVTADSTLGATPGLRVCLSVSDTGSGISAATLPHIFEPFFTTKEAGKGTGLGLATVYGIIKQHSGWIEVDTAPGKGTTFNLYFPAITGGETCPVDVTLNGEEPRHGQETVLVVEDETAVRTLVTKFLERAGYTVHQAASGDAAIEVWKEFRSVIRLVVTDVVMPGRLNGRALADRLTADDPNLKVIFSTGYSANILGQDQGSAGPVVLQKPYDADELLRAVRRALDSA